MPEYLAPGVYVEETSFRPKSIEGVSTSTTGFVGPTRRGPIAAPPELITSYNDFERIFGGYDDLSLGGVATANYLAHAVRAYFNEGGARLYVARAFTASGDGRASWSDATGLRFFARTPGLCGRGRLTLRPKLAPAGKATLDKAPVGTLLRVGTAAPAKPATMLGGVPPFALDDGATLNLKIGGTDLVATFRGQNAEITATNPLPDPVSLAPASHALGITIDGVTHTATLPDGDIARSDLVIALNAAMRGGYARLSATNQLILGSDRRGKSSSVGVAANAAFGFPADVAPTSPPAGATNNVNDLARVAVEEVDARLQEAVQATGAGAPGVSAVLDATTGRLALVTKDVGEAATISVSGAAATSAYAALGLKPLPVGGQPEKGANGTAQSHYVKTGDNTWADPSNAANTLNPLDASALAGGAATLTFDIEAADQSGATSTFADLGLDRRHPRWVGTILAEAPRRRLDALENVFAVDVPAVLSNAAGLFAQLFPNGQERWIDLTGGNDGLEPTSNDYGKALDALRRVEDISIVAAPGHSAYQSSADAVRQALLTHVETQSRYRIAVLDSKPGQILSEVREDRGAIDSTRAALYYPWVVVPNPLWKPGADNLPPEIPVPPSGFVCGIYARTDAQTGVWKAPANEVVFSALRFEADVNFDEQGSVNPLGINCLRSLSGRGHRVWGARTATSDPEWKYVNVRRYFNYLERSIDVGTQWAVFMPNGERLWADVTQTVEAFLYNEWRSGALLGTTTKEAYFVRCDRSTMTQNDRDNGRLICLVGVAVTKPAEFVIFRVGQKLADERA